MGPRVPFLPPVCAPSSWYIHPIKYLIIIAYIHTWKAEKNVITMVIESIQPFECSANVVLPTKLGTDLTT